MFIYLLCFAVSVFFAWRAEKTTSKSLFIACSILSIAPTVLLAGLRDISVGIDTANMYYNSWQVATRAKSFWYFIWLYSWGFRAEEFLFAFLLGAIQKTTGNFNVFLTVMHLIIIGCVYIGAFRLRRYCSPSLVLLLFYLFYYNHSLNILRQYVAMAILFAGTADIIERHYWRFLLIAFLAFMAHNTAVIGILPLLFFILLYPNNRLRAVSLDKRLALCVLVILGAIFVQPLVQVLIRVGLLGNKYQSYLETEGTDSYLVARVLVFLELIGIVLFRYSWADYKPYTGFFAFCTFVFGVLYQIAPSIPYGKRIPAYFSLINLVSLGILCTCQKKKSNRIIMRAVIVAAALSYWLLMYGYLNTSRTIPYVLGV